MSAKSCKKVILNPKRALGRNNFFHPHKSETLLLRVRHCPDYTILKSHGRGCFQYLLNTKTPNFFARIITVSVKTFADTFAKGEPGAKAAFAAAPLLFFHFYISFARQEIPQNK